MLTKDWRKSSRSGSQGGQCVEARHADLVVQVRDSKFGDTSPILSASAADWQGFLNVVAK